MFGLGSFQNSKWGWDFYKYPTLYGVTNFGTSTVGHFTSPTLAPNGIAYLLPTFNFLAPPSTTPFNEVIAIKPGKSNNSTAKWEASTIHRVSSNNPGKQPPLPNELTTTASAQKRFYGKGVVAPNNEIYFIGFRAKGIVALKPQSDPTLDPSAGENTSWRVANFSTVGINDGAQNSFCGGVLHSDGCIYMIPNPLGVVTNISTNPTSAQQVVRIKPRLTSVNPTISDIYEKSYYDGVTLARSFNSNIGPYRTPKDISNTNIVAPDTTPEFDSTWGANITDAISHPNGKIYMFGGVSRYIYILDPNNWTQQNCVYTDYNLRIPTDLITGPDYGIDGARKGAFLGASLEKLAPGQDPTTLKVILHFEGIVNTSQTTTVTNKYMRTLIFDPVANSITAAGDWYPALDTNNFPFQTSFPFRLPNGFTYNFGKIATPNLLGAQYTYSGNVAGQIDVKGPLTNVGGQPVYNDDLTRLVMKGGFMAYQNSSNVRASYFNNGANVVNQGDAFGKVIFGSLEGGGELVSVKGYYPGIKYFNYNPETDNSMYKIPDNLATDLKTSLWNSYFNKPM